jgi:acyl-ACP thioesterase
MMRVLEATLQIPYAGIGPDGRMKFPVLLDIFQDMADRDARRMDMSVANLLPRGVSWVLRRYSIRVDRYPVHGRELHVTTWHEPHRNLYSMRAFEMRDDDGTFATALTCWILIDVGRGRPIRLDRCSTPLYVSEARPVAGDLPDLPPFDGEDFEVPFRIREWDLDLNGHVNNAVYFAWAAEAVPDGVLRGRAISHVEAEFLRPTEGRGLVSVRTQTMESPSGVRSYLHSVLGADGAERARLFTEWSPRPSGAADS